MERILLMVLRNILRVPGAWLKLCRYAKHTEDYPILEQWQHIQYIMHMAVDSGNLELICTGKEHIPKEGGFLMYGNHQGMFDVVSLIATCDRPVAAVLKKELKDIPFLKQIIAITNSFPMDRDDLKQSMQVILNVIKEVKKGKGYLIFPEGTRSRKGNEMLEFHGGSFKCALKTKVPVVPVVYIDSFKVLDQKGCKPVKVQIHYLEPIYYEEYQDMNTIELAAYVQEKIRNAIIEHTKDEK